MPSLCSQAGAILMSLLESVDVISGVVPGTFPSLLLKTSSLLFYVRLFNLRSMEVCHGSVPYFKSIV